MTKEEHDRLVDLTNLQNRIKELEEICTGKSIQELGVNDLYKED